MYSFEEALSIVRKELPNHLIWFGFEYKGEWVFTSTPGKQFNPEDVSLGGFVVRNGKCDFSINYWNKAFTDREFAKASRNCKYVDITKEQDNRPPLPKGF